ncbi:LysR family transcriptional regulator [Modestobacter roseus]|uniref:DNA-binding transcriptional LysR family regulator n=1 Tax=Modestobacter roseus TaxID=1181884 RepID=A0A562ILI9_9ACTN|nr:LysR family transcriptional regulator [Modestobacter roseus]MQA32246.1 LysR family transcriptional regulator [Modestobacter roseus]TWH71742.1 DNA-binding transcriptional LysR family regulator [Modestobacter roseus]
MDLRSLETLRAVRSRGGVTAAAAVLHLTPSAVSQQLAALTAELGVPLTERVGRGLRLTPAGDALADAAVDVAEAVERARATCQAFAERPVGTVRVSAFQSAAQLVFPRLLGAAPDGVTLECADEDVALAEFPDLTDRFDVVLAHRPDGAADWPAGVRVVPLFREPLDVAVGPGHRLAGRTAVTPEELAGEEWITVREGFPVAPVLAAVATGSGAAPHIAHRINDFAVASAMVAAGHGVSLLPRHTTVPVPGLRLLPLAGVPAGRRVEALLRPDRAERRVVARVVEALAGIAAEIDRGEH